LPRYGDPMGMIEFVPSAGSGDSWGVLERFVNVLVL
jgi:hypothetical protein